MKIDFSNPLFGTSKPNPCEYAFRYCDSSNMLGYWDIYSEEFTATGRETNIYLEYWKILRFTPKGIVIECYRVGKFKEKFIAHKWLKKFAHLNLEEAQTAFLYRKSKQIGLLKGQLVNANAAYNLAKNKKWGHD